MSVAAGDDGYAVCECVSSVAECCESSVSVGGVYDDAVVFTVSGESVEAECA